MPVVFLNVELKANRRVEVKALLNSGAEDLDLVLPESLARYLGLKKEGSCDLLLFGRRRKTWTGKLEVSAINPESGEKRKAEMRAVVLKDKEVDCVILGTEGRKTEVIPDTVSGRPVFK
jgi:hypothetical protein